MAKTRKQNREKIQHAGGETRGYMKGLNRYQSDKLFGTRKGARESRIEALEARIRRGFR